MHIDFVDYVDYDDNTEMSNYEIVMVQGVSHQKYFKWMVLSI